MATEVPRKLEDLFFGRVMVGFVSDSNERDPDPDAGWVRAHVDAGRLAWPALALDATVAAQHVARHAEGAEPLPIEHAGDLYLACACAHGVAGAAQAFEKRYAGDLDASLARVV